MYAEHDIMYNIILGYSNIIDDHIIYTACDIMPHLTEIRLNIMGYIIAYIPVRAEPWLVLPAVLMVKSARKHFLIHLKLVSPVQSPELCAGHPCALISPSPAPGGGLAAGWVPAQVRLCHPP
jgi:hypothetical protein